MHSRLIIILLTFILLINSNILNASVDESDKEKDSISYYSNLAIKFYSKDSFDASFRAINKVFELGDSIENKKIFATLYSIKGYLYLNRGSSLKAIECFSKTRLIGNETNDIQMQISALHGLGRVNITTKNNDSAYYYLEEGLKLAKVHGFTRAQAILYNALGIFNQSINKYEESLSNFIRFDSISTILEDSLSILYAKVNIGEAYLNLNQIDSASKYNKIAENINKSINNAQAKASILGNYGRLFSLQGEYNKSIELINKSMKVSFDNNFSSFIIENYYMLIKDYKKIGNTLVAIKVYEELDQYKDSLYKANNQKNIEALQSQLILEEKTAKALYWQQKYKNRNILLALMISVSLLIIILLFLLLKRIKENKKKHSEETKNLTFEIDEKNRELVTLLISRNQRKTAFDSITKTIDSISNEKDISKVQNSLSELKRDLDKSDQIGNRWESFKIHFEKVHPDFFNSLKKIQPDLTQSELRMCAYIKMNLTSKEIANLQNISTRSIQTNRYRLKKKLSLSPNTNLINYIQNL